MLAELVDAVVGVDTHRDSHEVEIAFPNRIPIATCQVRTDIAGFAQRDGPITEQAPPFPG